MKLCAHNFAIMPLAHTLKKSYSALHEFPIIPEYLGKFETNHSTHSSLTTVCSTFSEVSFSSDILKILPLLLLGREGYQYDY